MEKRLIVSTYNNTIKSKTIELQREIFDKFNLNHYQRISFGTGMPSMEFQNYLWAMNDCLPNGLPPPLIEKIREGANKAVNADSILFLSSSTLPLSNFAIEFAFEEASKGKIVNFSLYDGIAFTKETYKKLGEPNMKDLFSSARKNKVPITTLTVKKVESNGSKTYSVEDKDLFFQVNNASSHDQIYWEKCEEVLVGGMYEDRSIKH